MFEKPVVLKDMSKGMNNVAQPDSLPTGYVRDLSNFDPMVGGSVSMRAGYAQTMPIANARKALKYGNRLVVVSNNIELIDVTSNERTNLGAAPAGSTIAGDEFNGDMFLQVGVTQLRIRDKVIGPWASDTPVVGVTVGTGGLPAGIYRVATTTVDAFGAECGTVPTIVSVPDNASLNITWGSGVRNVYASAVNSETLYFQTESSGSFVLSSTPSDNGERLLTGNLAKVPLATTIKAAKGRLMTAAGNVVWGTEPFAPHLVDPVRGFVLMPADVTVLRPVEDGIYVATAETTYFITNFGTEQMEMEVVAEVGAVSGSDVLLPDGTAAWMTPYGQARASSTGTIELPQRVVYAPAVATSAVAGIINNNGIEMLVTNQHGATQNALSVQSSFDLEITNE